jgi:hypothetical protein
MSTPRCANFNSENRRPRCGNDHMHHHILCERCYRESGGYVPARPRVLSEDEYEAKRRSGALL